MSALAPTMQAFFTERLIAGRRASPNTIAAYRDTLKLLLAFAAKRRRCQPCKLGIGDLDAPLIAAFLDHLERERGNSVGTRNARLAAIHSLFRYAALRHPEHLQDIERVLAIPPKRSERALVTFLDEHEIDALLAAPDRTTWTGRRDHAMLLTATQTGLRASELTGLNCSYAHLAAGPHLSCRGKGRKERITPLTIVTVAVLRVWLAERQGQPHEPLFPTSRGRRLSRDGLERRLTKHVNAAARGCPSLREKTITPHTLRHTAAMQLLQAGVDTTVIALWLGHYVGDQRSPRHCAAHIMFDHAGDRPCAVPRDHPHIKHERVDTTQIYLHADLALKERALARTKPPDAKPGRYQPPDTLLAFLEAL